MGRVRTTAAALLALAFLSAAAQAEPYRALNRAEVPSLILDKVKDWALGLSEVQAVEDYMRDTEAWTPRFKAAAGAAGAAFGYFEGGAGSFNVGAWNVSLEASGQQLQRALSRRNGRLLGIGLGRPDKGWSAEAVLGLRDGRFLSQSVNVAYKIRY
ncbi:hypothetical protein EPO15_12880 [bacterium]|nr:MAG: hypothetical protein EPO15_12880 [bacterium]